MGASIAGPMGVIAMALAGLLGALLLMPLLRRWASILAASLGVAAETPQPHAGAAAVLGCTVGGMCGLAFGSPLQAVGALCLSLGLVTLAWVDLETRLLPDFLTMPLLGIGLLFNLAEVFTSWPQAVVGAALGYGCLWGVAAVYHRWTGQHGLGGGDLKCVAALGAWLGWQALPALLLWAALLSVASGVLILWKGQHPEHHMQAFGPWLAVSGLVALFTTSGSTAPWWFMPH